MGLNVSIGRSLSLGIIFASCALVVAEAYAGEARRTFVFEAEDVSAPADAWEHDKHSATKWNLWSTDRDAEKKWSGGVVLQSPRVLEDRGSAEEGAPPLHTRVTRLPPGRYAVEIKLGRTLAVSRDGRNWTRQSGRELGVFEIADGTFELWVDDRYAHPTDPGSAYYDCLTFRPLPARALELDVAQLRIFLLASRLQAFLRFLKCRTHGAHLAAVECQICGQPACDDWPWDGISRRLG